MIAQVLAQSESVLTHLYEEACKSADAVLSDEKVAKDLLSTCLGGCNKSYIVLDGLDEYSQRREDQKEVCAWFQEIIKSASQQDIGAVRCLFVRQDDGYARHDLADIAQIRITATENTLDIARYCRMWHREIEKNLEACKNQSMTLRSS